LCHPDRGFAPNSTGMSTRIVAGTPASTALRGDGPGPGHRPHTEARHGEEAARRREFTGPEAAELAGISYRQLDYWARRGWVVPSGEDVGGVQRRVYNVADVVRLAALGHLGRSRVDVATFADATGRVRVPEGHAYLIVWSIHEGSVRSTTVRDVRRVAAAPGRYVIFDPAPLLRTLDRRAAAGDEPRARRRTFSAEYKAMVLDEYARLTEPGAKSRLLRREGLHTSHLVAWRRSLGAGDLEGRAGIVGPAGGGEPLRGVDPPAPRSGRSTLAGARAGRLA